MITLNINKDFAKGKSLSSPIIRTRKSRGSFEPRLFSYDDVELKPPKRRGPQKIRKIFWGRGAVMERLRCFIEDKTPISEICRDESPIIRTKKQGTRLDTISSLVFLFYVGIAH